MTIIEKFIPITEGKPTGATFEKPVLNTKDDIAIPHNLSDLSTYSKFLALYARNPEDAAYHSIEEKQDCKIKQEWEFLIKYLQGTEPTESSISENLVEYIVPSDVADRFTNSLGLPVKVSEYTKEGESQIRGCITTIENENDFNDWFILHILDQTRLALSEVPFETANAGQSYHEKFADFFEESLKNTIIDDQWEAGGRDYFIKRAKYFTDRNLKIECVLPAFPCKSSNFDKVGGIYPDKGEEFALRRLIKATQDAQKVYPPGMKIWIVSDGHVFSDCIGVDDDIVTSYTAKLHQLYENIKIPGVDAIGFCGLNDLFFSGAAASKFKTEWIEDVQLDHLTGTQICPVSDVSRGILMKGCDTDDGRLRKQISIDGHPRLHLYRGFSRFMLEDLSRLSFFEGCSRKGFKKTISKIAFNMIRRNDAYSNLVELIFPHHMRLSIHAHTNSGPKFGVKVISSEQCRIVKSLDDLEEPKFEDLLHIPTPWHNCVVKVDDNHYVLTKASVVKEALENGSYVGEWVETWLELGEGGHYNIRKFE
ncbi:hypothetical protein HG537_0A05090 [Torulaspora globosa]|uniref:TauD/TfdA-like domain-containing protein n=1 Tax=Torulaspora globosa TaxID=48254 RepID=A0A7H9HPN0_9SACH|nr:hypothetical protein HG537_0A05090 [Torulaspora sp. CBS 2947]